MLLSVVPVLETYQAANHYDSEALFADTWLLHLSIRAPVFVLPLCLNYLPIVRHADEMIRRDCLLWTAQL